MPYDTPRELERYVFGKNIGQKPDNLAKVLDETSIKAGML